MAKQKHRIVVDVLAQTKGFQEGLKAGRQSAKRFGNRMKGLKRILAVVGFAAVGQRILRMVKAQAVAVDQMAKFADQIGISTERLAGLQHAAELTGVGTRTLQMGLQRMTRRIAEAAQGAGEARGAIKELGLDAQQLAAAGPGAAFEQIAEAIAKVESQSDKVRLAFKLFDSEGVALVNTLEQGKDGLEAMQKEARDLGLTISRVDAASIERMNDATTKVAAAWQGLIRSLLVDFAPVIVDAVNSLTSLIKLIGIAVKDMKEFAFSPETKAFFHIATKGLFLDRSAPERPRQRRGTPAEAREALRAARAGPALPPSGVAAIPANVLQTRFEALKKSLVRERETIFVSSEARLALAHKAHRELQTAEWQHNEIVKRIHEDRAQAIADIDMRETGPRMARLDSIQASLDTERLATARGFDEKLLFLDGFLATEHERLAEADLARRQIEEQKEQALTAIDKRESAKRISIARMEVDRKLQATQSILGAIKTIASISAGESERAFKIQKGAAIAEAVVNTAAGITRALRLPFPLNWAQAAAVGASGIAQIASIRATTFGGGSVASVSGAGATATGAGASAPAPQEVFVNLPQGNDTIFTGNQLRALVDGLNETHADGYRLKVA